MGTLRGDKMKQFKSIKYVLKHTNNGILLCIPDFNINEYVDKFNEADIFNYLEA